MKGAIELCLCENAMQPAPAVGQKFTEALNPPIRVEVSTCPLDQILQVRAELHCRIKLDLIKSLYGPNC